MLRLANQNIYKLLKTSTLTGGCFFFDLSIASHFVILQPEVNSVEWLHHINTFYIYGNSK